MNNLKMPMSRMGKSQNLKEETEAIAMRRDTRVTKITKKKNKVTVRDNQAIKIKDLPEEKGITESNTIGIGEMLLKKLLFQSCLRRKFLNLIIISFTNNLMLSKKKGISFSKRNLKFTTNWGTIWETQMKARRTIGLSTQSILLFSNKSWTRKNYWKKKWTFLTRRKMALIKNWLESKTK